MHLYVILSSFLSLFPLTPSLYFTPSLHSPKHSLFLSTPTRPKFPTPWTREQPSLQWTWLLQLWTLPQLSTIPPRMDGCWCKMAIVTLWVDTDFQFLTVMWYIPCGHVCSCFSLLMSLAVRYEHATIVYTKSARPWHLTSAKFYTTVYGWRFT